MQLPVMNPQPGTWPATQASALTGNRTSDPLFRRSVLNPLSHTSQGRFILFYLTQKYSKIHINLHYMSWNFPFAQYPPVVHAIHPLVIQQPSGLSDHHQGNCSVFVKVTSFYLVISRLPHFSWSCRRFVTWHHHEKKGRIDILRARKTETTFT